MERTTRYVMLLHLPEGRGAEGAGAAMRRAITTLPGELFRTITWDQGKEMAYHAQFTIAAGPGVYFCDPHKPWQRGSNEDANGLPASERELLAAGRPGLMEYLAWVPGPRDPAVSVIRRTS